MNIIIDNSSMIPIYEQIANKIKSGINSSELLPGSVLPSVRGLANELKISALTVKKAYDFLEEQGYVVTVHGKGTFIATLNKEQMLEEQKKEVENELDRVIQKAFAIGLSEHEIRELFELVLED